MVLLKRLAAIYLIAVALAVALNWLATPIYHDGSANYPIWEILNWFMAVSFPLMLLVNAWRRYDFSRRDRDRTVTREYLETNVALAASLVLNLWFFWNWFGALFPGAESEAVALVHLEWWAFINPLGALWHGFTGAYLWRSASGKPALPME